MIGIVTLAAVYVAAVVVAAVSLTHRPPHHEQRPTTIVR
jgi:hypothetical protein